ncbi:MAG TPA: hypothetical protein PKI88_05030 [Agitococcus sp.]|nr:hypothetical protein [Agitococcus sp.]HMV61571.1 hypothetical protein [Agitococcus sp.]HNC03097.1 hypothetical protein [Agitococcus sp.]HNG47136.1 hypothetical protein [Agitococcus sp.]HNL36450.1 hypothetical protein [Agitococcus sp.]
MMPIVSFAAKGDDLEELRADSKRNNEWILVKKDQLKDITTWAKREDGKNIRSFKIEMIAQADLETIARVHFDVDNIKRWFWETKESKLLKKVNDKEYYYYQVFNAPLTIPDRDAIIRVQVEPFNAKRGYMAMKLTFIAEFMPAQPGKVRVDALNYYLRFTPIDKNTTRIEVDGYVDPGGITPAWAINFVQRTAPYTTMIGLARMLQLPYYREGKEALDFTYME